MFFSIEFSASAAIAILLIVLDKIGKLTLPILVILFCLASALAIHPAFSNPWTKAASSFGWKIWRAGFCLTVVALSFSALGIWIFSGKANAEAANGPPSIQPAPINAEKKSQSVAKPPHQNIQKAQNSGSGHVVQQQGQTNIAQVGDNNQVNQITVTGLPARRLSPEQKERLASALAPYKDTPFEGVYALAQDSEGNVYAQDFFQAFKAAGWNTGAVVGQITSMTTGDPDNPLPKGLWVVVSRDDAQSPPVGANSVYQALKSIGLNPKGMTLNIPKGVITVLVGLNDPRPDGPVGVYNAPGGTFVSTCSVINAPNGRAIENHGDVIANHLSINAPNSCSPSQLKAAAIDFLLEASRNVRIWDEICTRVLQENFDDQTVKDFMMQSNVEAKKEFLRKLKQSLNP